MTSTNKLRAVFIASALFTLVWKMKIQLDYGRYQPEFTPGYQGLTWSEFDLIGLVAAMIAVTTGIMMCQKKQ